MWAHYPKLLFLTSLFFLCTESYSKAQDVQNAPELFNTYKEVAAKIIQAADSDQHAYKRLTYLCDTFGNRPSGSKRLEKAIDWALETMKHDKLDNVHGEPVRVPHWERGYESAVLLSPRRTQLTLVGLGGSIPTPPEGITSEVIVVKSLQQLAQYKDKINDKIVLINEPFTTYGETITTRTHGAIEAAKYGAKACLIRSVTDFSLGNPHTGIMYYDPKVTKIPAAALSLEDAEMLQRMQDRGQKIQVKLLLSNKRYPNSISRNVIADIKGYEKPDEVVIVSGHLDSWDVGQGAVDDAGGAMIAWEAIRLLKQLGLRPRRTIRAILWTCEEWGGYGGRQYVKDHKNQLGNHILAIESDGGVFSPIGFSFSGNKEAYKVIRQAAQLLNPIGADNIIHGGGGEDISYMMQEDVPGMGLRVRGGRYFWYHHSVGDTIDKLNKNDIDKCLAAFTVMAYVIADMPDNLPR